MKLSAICDRCGERMPPESIGHNHYLPDPENAMAPSIVCGIVVEGRPIIDLGGRSLDDLFNDPDEQVVDLAGNTIGREGITFKFVRNDPAMAERINNRLRNA